MRMTLAILALALTVGCDATLRQFQGLKASPANEYSRKANAHEQASEFQQALLAWRIAAQLDRGNGAITGNIQRLEKLVSQMADERYQKGLALMQAGKPVQARQEMLKVLLLAPGHRQAGYLIKTRLRRPHRTVYKVKPGDSFSRIALATYNDPTKAFTVAHFNGLNPKKPLRIGTALTLPDLDASYIVPRSDMAQLLEKARAALANKQYARAASMADTIIGEVPDHRKARRLGETARLALALDLKQRGRYLKALALLQRNSPRQKGRDEAMVEIRRLISQQALGEKMDAARDQLASGDHRAVMAITESILADHPDHAPARALQNEAGYTIGKSLIEKKQAQQAVVWLEKVDAAYADTAQQLSLARARTKAAAEERYREGVKHFINENLEAAIQDWQQTLDLNPDHPKARQDMENAQRLLEKWRKLDKTPPDQSNTD